MFKQLQNISYQQQGVIAIFMGLILLAGALVKLGFLQDIVNLLIAGVGILLIFWGLITSEALIIKKKK